MEAQYVERTSAHLSDYTASLRLCVRKLVQTHLDMGLTLVEQAAAFDRASTRALTVWTEACENADADRHALNEKVCHDELHVVE